MKQNINITCIQQEQSPKKKKISAICEIYIYLTVFFGSLFFFSSDVNAIPFVETFSYSWYEMVCIYTVLCNRCYACGPSSWSPQFSSRIWRYPKWRIVLEMCCHDITWSWDHPCSKDVCCVRDEQGENPNNTKTSSFGGSFEKILKQAAEEKISIPAMEMSKLFAGMIIQGTTTGSWSLRQECWLDAAPETRPDELSSAVADVCMLLCSAMSTASPLLDTCMMQACGIKT